MLRMAISPEEHSRLTVEMGTSCGIPAAIAAAREMYRGEGGWQVPEGVQNSDIERQDSNNTRTHANIIYL